MKLFVAIVFVVFIGAFFVDARAVRDSNHVSNHEPVGHLQVARDTKSDLIARGSALLSRAFAAVVELVHANNVHEANIIRSEEAKIRALIAELELANSTSSITLLEHQLSAAEQQLTFDLEKINHRAVVDPVVHH